MHACVRACTAGAVGEGGEGMQYARMYACVHSRKKCGEEGGHVCMQLCSMQHACVRACMSI